MLRLPFRSRRLPLKAPTAPRARLTVEALEERVVPTHGRYLSLTWEPVSLNSANRVIEFHYQFAWLTPFFGGEVVGAVVNTDTIDYGDSNFDPIPTRILSLIGGVAFGEAVRDIDPGPGMVWEEGLLHTYPAAGDFTATINSCCRISTLQNNPDDTYQAQTTVNVGTGNRPPIVATAPVVQVADNTVVTLPIGAFDPDADTLRFRIATSSEAEAFPFGYALPPLLTVNPTTGVVTWDITNVANPPVAPGQFWTIQIMVEDLNAAGNPKSKVPVDFLIQVVSTAGNAPPQFNTPPTPVTPLGLSVGQTVSFIVQANDVNAADTVTLAALNPPAGMVATPIAPPSAVTPANASALQFVWTPSVATPAVIILMATDSPGLFSVTTVIINPGVPPVVDEGSYAGATPPGPPPVAGQFPGGEGSFGFGGGRDEAVPSGDGEPPPLTIGDPTDSLIVPAGDGEPPPLTIDEPTDSLTVPADSGGGDETVPSGDANPPLTFDDPTDSLTAQDVVPPDSGDGLTTEDGSVTNSEPTFSEDNSPSVDDTAFTDDAGLSEDAAVLPTESGSEESDDALSGALQEYEEFWLTDELVEAITE